ncbi:putative membrane protein [Serinicoccus hydrothermalis]|uniref:Putative membrane protein n=1 Tax=Serinicoccus hydrothermalis TaxID=1758689 RepID=A0A1B1N856_9MICO|nr:PH domain-containing protein [Serinicoccus hydrothermalis]ANS77607.1 putative membrane protein [Serinicoccus hydrothermalis]
MSDATGPYAPFRPVTGARVARVAALASVLLFGLIALFGPSYAGSSPTMSLLNRIFILLFGLVMGAFLWRYALIRAIPSPTGLTVVNLVLRRDLEWSQVASVTFADGAPWVVLELTDTEELAVMAIQRADGRRAKEEASRLAALVEHHQR